MSTNHKAVKPKETRFKKGDLNEVIGQNEISKDGGVFGYKQNEEPNEELIIGSQNLNIIPTKIDSNGNEVVVFDEVLVAKGSKRWEMTVVAYTTNGISALASKVGKLMVMDAVTTTMCKNGVGKNGSNEVICRKNVKVMYDWKPSMCLDCSVFGHNAQICPKNIRVENKVSNTMICNEEQKKWENKKQMSEEEGFVEVKNKKTCSKGERVTRQNFRPNTQHLRNGNNKRIKSKKKQVTQFSYQPKKKDVNERQRKSDGMEAHKEGVDRINVEKQNGQK
ncbi:hypothetical protein Tco_0078389 [Tanacetum coccineum]